MIKKITVEIDGEDKEMSYEAAQKLFFDLQGIFGKQEVVTVPTVFPVTPPNWQEWPYKITCTGDPFPQTVTITGGCTPNNGYGVGGGNLSN